jgi:RNA polymerase sigma-70 factor (ECF subfamily)
MKNYPVDGLPLPFEETMRLHEREIMRFILRTTHDREDALDLFQETWLRAYRAYPRLEGADGIRPWLFRIATNLCLNRVRDRVRRSRVIAESEPGDLDAAPAIGGSHDGVIRLKAAIAKLPRKQKDALIMRKFGGLDYDEIGAALGCSNDAARADVYQAVKKIKAMEEA